MTTLLKKIGDRLRRRPVGPTVEEYTRNLIRLGYSKDGNVVLDDVPMAPPIGYKKSPSMVEIVRDLVRQEKLAKDLEERGMETFEDSEDFDVGDDPEQLRSPYENQFDPLLSELAAAGKAAIRERERQEARKPKDKPAEKAGGAGGTPPAEGGETPPEAS